MKPDNIKKTFVNPLVLPSYSCDSFNMYNGKEEEEDNSLNELYGDSSDAVKKNLGSPYSFWYDFMPMMPENMQRFKTLWVSAMAFQTEGAYRASADPVGLYYEGKWYLYATDSCCWSSPDFIHWEFHDIGVRFIAPDIAVRKGKFYLAGNGTALYTADSPTGPFMNIGDFTWQGKKPEPDNNDVSIFVDEDDRMYLYWGMGPGIWGAELDPDNPSCLITEPKQLVAFDPNHWWERVGASNQDWSNGFIEGSNMIKINGVYYLQYSCSGTEYDSYAMGCYKSSEGPLDGFVLQETNPICRKTEGLYRGVGHAAVCRGPEDTLWMFETVCGNYGVERRLACDPAMINEKGDLVVLNHYDGPQYVPGTADDPGRDNGADVDNLTLGHQMWASSWSAGRNPEYGVDGNIKTWWQPGDEDEEPVFYVGLRGEYDIFSARVMFKEIGEKINPKGGFTYRIEVYDGLDAKDHEWTTLVEHALGTEDQIYFYDTFEKPVRAIFTRLVITGMPEGVKPGLIDYSLFGRSTARE